MSTTVTTRIEGDLIPRIRLAVAAGAAGSIGDFVSQAVRQHLREVLAGEGVDAQIEALRQIPAEGGRPSSRPAVSSTERAAERA